MMKSVSIDLAEDYGSCCMPEPMEKGRVHYPSLHISSDEELDLPDAGKMVVSFRKIRSEEIKDERGERYNCTIEVQSIDGVETAKKASKRPDEEFDERMDEYMKAKTTDKD